MSFSRTWILILLCSLPAYAADKVVEVSLLEARPTQSTVGMEEVRIRQKLIEEASAKGPAALDRLLRENPGSVIRGPFGQLHLVDGHHFARALHEAGIGHMYVEVGKDWADKTPEEFWSKMINKQKVYLKKFGKDLGSPAELPKLISELEDDPYRSLAWLLKKKGAYENLDIPFQEFLYADYLRDRVDIDFSSPDAVEKTMKAAEKALRDADHLPGHIKGKAKDGLSKCDMKSLFKSISVL